MKEKKQHSFRDRFNYWFDNRMSKGSLSFIRFLIVVTLMFALLIAALIIIFRFNEEGETASVLWNSIATVLNAWMPYFEEGSPGYLILMSLTAIAGVLFTSVLIGIVTSAIEEKIIELKRGNSAVLEEDHIVVLGFNPGEYTLIHQLILAAEGKPACIVIADELEREEIEDQLEENLDIPKNIRIVCRTVDITDPASIEKCSVEKARTVIISPGEDSRTVKAILAVSLLLKEKEAEGVQVNAIISREKYRFPQSLAEMHSISTLQIDAIIAKMIAHSCTQMGLSETFREIFNFEGSEFYLLDLPEITGKTFAELTARLDHAVPSGIMHDGRITMNPPADQIIEEGDSILIFAETSDAAKLTEASHEELPEATEMIEAEADEDTVIIGYNETLPVILGELPDNVTHVYLVNANADEEERAELLALAERRGLRLDLYNRNLRNERNLVELAKIAEHVVILSDHDKPDEEADMDVIFLLLHFRDLRTRYELSFNITVEMQREHNQRLIDSGDHTDFLVTSSMSSLILAQLAESPQLIDVFRELLSNRGNELFLKSVKRSGLAGTHTIRELRSRVLRSGYILLGYVDADRKSHFNQSLDESVTLGAEDNLIVLGEE